MTRSGAFVRAIDLPPAPLDAAATFHADIVPVIRECWDGMGDVVIGFAAADHTHVAWRRAAIQELAREAAPVRVNAVAGDGSDVEGYARTIEFLHSAPGITGQILEVAGNGGERG